MVLHTPPKIVILSLLSELYEWYSLYHFRGLWVPNLATGLVKGEETIF